MKCLVSNNKGNLYQGHKSIHSRYLSAKFLSCPSFPSVQM
uniref:Uncharacterized protein n=1 Tax=Rhizophora mucronata TaxID=61149 RepID=A0A2P2QNV9_RHIMU